MKIDLTKQVKFSNPQKGEENMIFNVVNYNEVTERCYIELVCNLPIKPQELVSINEIQNI
jgi:hypothetical protein